MKTDKLEFNSEVLDRFTSDANGDEEMAWKKIKRNLCELQDAS